MAAEEPEAGTLTDLDADVRRADEARWLASRFAPAPSRRRLVALYAFNHEIARVRETVSDPLVGEIRFAWWREAIAEIYEGPDRVRRHPIVLALRDALADPSARPPRALFDALIDARARDLDERRFADMAELSAYATATAGGLMKLAARMVGSDGMGQDGIGQGEAGARIDAGLEAAGRAWGLAGLARAFPVHAASGWVVVPDAPHAVEIVKLVADHDADRMRALTAPLVEGARAALVEARLALAGAPAALWPAYGYAALVLAQLREAQGDPFVVRKPGIVDRMRLVASAVHGSI